MNWTPVEGMKVRVLRDCINFSDWRAGQIGTIKDINYEADGSVHDFKVCANGDFWWHAMEDVEPVKSPTIGHFIKDLSVMHLSTKTKRIDFVYDLGDGPVKIFILAHFEESWTSADLIISPEQPLPWVGERAFGSMSYRRTNDEPDKMIGLFYALKFAVKDSEATPALKKTLYQMVRLLNNCFKLNNLLEEDHIIW
jgi:hypothetical protein